MTGQHVIFRPVLALVMLTFLVLLRIPFVRVRAALRGQVTANDFKLGESPRVPEPVSLPNRNMMNLLELPMLFYVLALALYVTQRVDSVKLALAWTYVAFRVAHTLVHLTTNNVFVRLSMYGLSNVALGTMWTLFALAVL